MNPFADVSSVLFVHAHPDDETLSSGGLILWLVANGVSVDLLTATRGERGEIVASLRHEVGDDPADLTERRERELAAAVDALGITRSFVLGEPPARAEGLAPRRYSDSGMRWVTPTLAGPVDDAPAEALTHAHEDEAVADLVVLLRHLTPGLVVSYDDEGGYGHPDHRFVRAAALTASRLAGVPFAELVPADTQDAFLLDARDRLPQITDALRAHATQLTVDGAEIVHSGGQREPIATAFGVRLVPTPAGD